MNTDFTDEDVKIPLHPPFSKGEIFPSIKRRGLRGVFPSLAKRGKGRFFKKYFKKEVI